MSMTSVLNAALIALSAAAALPAMAQATYPERPITVIVPQGPGGANDTIARIVLQKVSAILKQPMIVDNRPGAGGNIGTVLAAKAKPDGYTLMLTTNGTQVINPSLYKSTGFDPVKDFVPVATVATAGYVLVANPSFPAQSVSEVVAHVKKSPPGAFSYASAGNGTLNHLAFVMFEKAAGVQLTHVPYKSAAASVTDVVSGQVPLSMQSLPSSLQFIKTGKLKAIGMVNPKRVASLPDTPTIGETFSGFGASPWYGILAPAGTPKPIVDRVQAAVFEALDSKEVQDQLALQGCEIYKLGSADFAKLIALELPQWARVVKDSGATVD